MSVSSSATTFNLTEDELIKLEKETELGSSSSAFRLYQYYAFSNYDESKELYWLEIAAKLGSDVAQYNLAQRYFYKDKNFTEAKEWMQRASKSGHPKAKDFRSRKFERE